MKPIHFSLLFTSLHESKEREKLALVNAGLNTVINYELGKVQLGTSVCPNGESTVTKCVNEILADVLAVHNINENFSPMWEVKKLRNFLLNSIS